MCWIRSLVFCLFWDEKSCQTPVKIFQAETHPHWQRLLPGIYYLIKTKKKRKERKQAITALPSGTVAKVSGISRINMLFVAKQQVYDWGKNMSKNQSTKSDIFLRKTCTEVSDQTWYLQILNIKSQKSGQRASWKRHIQVSLSVIRQLKMASVQSFIWLMTLLFVSQFRG